MSEEALDDADGVVDGDPLSESGGEGLLSESWGGGRSKGHGWILAAAGAALLALPVLHWFATPDARGYGTHEQLGLPPCMLMELAGVPCPGCGVTTAVVLATHGHIGDSFVTHPFGLLVAVAIPLFAAWAFWAHATGRDLYRLVTGPLAARWLIPAGATLLASWIYKIAAVWSA